jgi:hypothetical protein
MPLPSDAITSPDGWLGALAGAAALHEIAPALGLDLDVELADRGLDAPPGRLALGVADVFAGSL